MRVRSSFLALGHWDRVEKGSTKEITKCGMGEEGIMSWPSSLSFQDDSCRHHFPSDLWAHGHPRAFPA